MPTNREIDQFLTQARATLDAAREDVDIQGVMAPFGYDLDAIDALVEAVDTAEARYRDQQREYAEQYAATSAFDEKRAALAQKLSRHRRLGRVAFADDDEAYVMLGLNGRLKRDFDGMMQQALQFYTVLREQPAVQARLAPLTVDAAAVESAFETVGAVQLAKAHQRIETREAQQATQQRDDAVAEARGRLADFLEVARIATMDRPQLRESLGLVTPA